MVTKEQKKYSFLIWIVSSLEYLPHSIQTIVFAETIHGNTELKRNCCSFWIQSMTVFLKLDKILHYKLFQNLKLSRNNFNKIFSTDLLFLIGKKSEWFGWIFECQNWYFLTNWPSLSVLTKCNRYPLSVLIFPKNLAFSDHPSNNFYNQSDATAQYIFWHFFFFAEFFEVRKDLDSKLAFLIGLKFQLPKFF